MRCPYWKFQLAIAVVASNCNHGVSGFSINRHQASSPSRRSRLLYVRQDDMEAASAITDNKSFPWKEEEDMDVYIRNEYQQWLSRYPKKEDSKYPIFRQNFLDQLDYDLEHSDGKKFFRLNEYGDLTREEYQEVICSEVYDTWRQKYSKKLEDSKYEVFKNNLLSLQKGSALHDLKQLPLTEYADLTQEQYAWLVSDDLFIKQRYAKWLQDCDKTTGHFENWKINYQAQLHEIQQNTCQHCVQSLVFDTYSDWNTQDYEKELDYQREYQEWCSNFERESNMARFEIFKANLKAHPSMKTMNKFADLTVGEFATVVSTEAFVQKEFEIWLEHYGKETGCYPVFKGNYLLQLEEVAKKHCIESFVFDEFSDLTQPEYERELVLQFEYKEWCKEYNKNATSARFLVFKGHRELAMAKNVSLSQDADLTPSEYMTMASDDAMIAKEFQEWLNHYGKKTGSFETFKANYLVQLEEKLKDSCSYESFVFDEYSDLNAEEYEEELELQTKYREWARQHTKITTNKRYLIFKENYARSVSNRMELNEDADLTKEEFTDMVSAKSFIEREFKDWLDYYGKPYGSFDTFRDNYLVQLEDIKEFHCFRPFVFDEHADKTNEECGWEPIYEKQYVGWLRMYGKEQNDCRFEVFKKNVGSKIRASLSNHTNLTLTEYADQTKEEFFELASSPDYIEQQYKAWLQDHEKTSGSFETFSDVFRLNLRIIDHCCEPLKIDQDADEMDVQTEVESLCRAEYKKWCSKFGKEQNDDRYAMFKLNFMQKLLNTTGIAVRLDNTADEYTQEGLELERRYQTEYFQWLEAFGKQKDEEDYEVFKANFLKQLEYNEANGASFRLNEYAALTKKQYIELMASPENVRKEYTKWTKAYGKPLDETRFVVFQKNFLEYLELEEELDSGNTFHLNELGDTEEWEMESFYEEKYNSWAEKYSRSKSDARYQTFKTNFVRQLQYNQANQKCCSLNEFADMTEKQWEKRISQGETSKKEKGSCKSIVNKTPLGEDAPFYVSNPVQEAETLSFSWANTLPL